MARLMKKRTMTIGMSPGTLIHIGERKEENVVISYMKYSEDHFEEKRDVKLEQCFQNSHKSEILWINIDGIHDLDVVKKIGITYNSHSLVLEDILNTSQRPKFEDYGDYIFLVIKMPLYDKDKMQLKLEQVSFILRNNEVISFQEKAGDLFNPVRDRIRFAKGRIRKMQADYLAYALVDAVVDNYFVILERLADKTEQLEEELVSESCSDILQKIYTIKREMIQLRKAIWPMKEVAESLVKADSDLLSESINVFLKDLSDHTVQLFETVEMLRDMSKGIHEIFSSQNSNKLNEIMKVLTIFGVIFIPLTFIAGIYGMNFEHMPELKLRWAYPVLLTLMFTIGISLFVYFKKKNWL